MQEIFPDIDRITTGVSEGVIFFFIGEVILAVVSIYFAWGRCDFGGDWGQPQK